MTGRRMALWRPLLLTWMALLALTLASASASARTHVGPKPHVGAFDVVAAICIEAHGPASAEGHPGNRGGSTTGTSDVPDAARAGLAGCFSGDTEILTRDGPRRISDVQEGDEVWSFDSERQEWRWMRVTRTFVHEHEGPVYTVSIGGAAIDVTGNHPICVAEGIGLSVRARPHDIGSDPLECGVGGRWVEAGDLVVGDVVLDASGASVITNIGTVGSSLPVYNLEVEGTHTYSVGPVGLLVHNKAAWASYANQLAGRFGAEAAAAARVGASPVRATAANLGGVASQGTMKFVVTEAGELIVSPHTVRGVEISHAVLSGGRPVLTAGQAEIGVGGGQFFGIRMTPHSGHFMPSEASLTHARQAFRALGVTFP